VLVSEEYDNPYDKPPLSKGFISQGKAIETIERVKKSALKEKSIQAIFAEKVYRVDRLAKKVYFSCERVLAYSKLVIATGGSALKLKCQNANFDNVLYLRNLSDAVKIKSRLDSTRSVVIIGSGTIGLELAASIRSKDIAVKILGASDQVLKKIGSPILSSFIENIFLSNKVIIHLNKKVVDFIAGNNVSASSVLCSDGECISADLFIVAIGMIPNTELAIESGLAVDKGILTNVDGVTSDLDVYAVGDCANTFHSFVGQHIQLESVQGAINQARNSANHILGIPTPKLDIAPTFWTELFDYRIQMFGLCIGYDNVAVRGKIKEGSFTIFYFKNRKIISAHISNRPNDISVSRKIVNKKMYIPKKVLEDTARELMFEDTII
jgi:3-phenylpropionate/trans-cinnamate dioxygenase ferredoxin reductase subunit